ncbi:MAG: acyl-CoA dehydratase activase, partial [Clostridiales Family XIII bacterium]|nr:acyl-CoA dehydratase activase [Clostridiales Family XIII bacterium]
MTVLYLCRYAPEEVLRAMGAETEYLEPDDADLAAAEAALHPAMCSFSKAAYDAICRRMDADAGCGVLFTSCCDSTRRLYDVVRERYPDRFVHMLELPVKQDAAARDAYRHALEHLIDAYGEWSGAAFDSNRLRDVLRAAPLPSSAANAAKKQTSPRVARPRVGLAGAKIPPSLIEAVERAGGQVVFNLSCSGQEHAFEPISDAASPPDVLDAYVRGIFGKYPCMRMVGGDGGARLLGLERAVLESGADGVVYHTVKFCDNYAYEYAALTAPATGTRNGNARPAQTQPRSQTSTPDAGYPALAAVPFLKIETEYANATGSGQLATRLEAFVEQLQARHRIGAEQSPPAPPEAQETTMKTTRIALGIDSGSTSTNAVLLAAAAPRVLAAITVPTGPIAAESAAAARAAVLAKAGLTDADIDAQVATGYGRSAAANILSATTAVPSDSKNSAAAPPAAAPAAEITEITCHAAGAHFLDPRVRTIIDIGGQDSKVIRIDEDGRVAGFAMNDKCAAGTGRFLEMTARSLGVPLEDIGTAALRAADDPKAERADISSMCTVFAESEVVSLVAAGKRTEDILWALCRAVARRNEALLARAAGRPPYMMTGGVAKN